MPEIVVLGLLVVIILLVSQLTPTVFLMVFKNELHVGKDSSFFVEKVAGLHFRIPIMLFAFFTIHLRLLFGLLFFYKP